MFPGLKNMSNQGNMWSPSLCFALIKCLLESVSYIYSVLSRYGDRKEIESNLDYNLIF